jgi:hypothetical protein
MTAHYTPQNHDRSSDPEPGPSMDSFKRSTRLFSAEDSAVDAERTGAFSFAAWIPLVVVFAVGFLYVSLESTWNTGMLDSISNPHTDAQELNWMISEGRWLTAFGLTYAFMKGMFNRAAGSLSSALSTAVLIGGVTVLAYAGIGRAYDFAIDALPPTQALQMYKTAVHRTWAVGGELKKLDPSTKDPVAVALWPLKVADDAQAKDIEGVFDERAANAMTEVTALAHKEWPAVESKLGSGEDPAIVRREFEQDYVEYIALSTRAKSVFSSWQTQRSSDMESYTGMTPNAGATPAEFAQQLLRSRLQRHRDLGKMFIATQGGSTDPVVWTNGALQLRGSDFKGVQDEAGFTKMLQAKAMNSVVADVPTAATVKSRDDAHQVIAAAMIPAMAMTLSCLGILLNIGSLVGLLFVRAPVLRHVPQWFIPGAFVGVVLVLTPATNTLPGLNVGLTWLHSNYTVLSMLVERVITLEHLALENLR